MFIVIDGIDGSGKGTIINFWKEELAAEGNGIFDLKNYIKETCEYPSLTETRPYDFIFSAEPTYTGVGKVIREELIKNGNNYSMAAIAQAYSLDRLILYKKMYIPLLADGRCIIADRSFSTSLAYQTFGGEMNFAGIAALPGNALALEHRPDHLIICDLQAEEALARLNERGDKKDNAVFEKLEFLKKAEAQFKNPEYQKIFTDRGTAVHYLSTADKIDIIKQKAVALLKTIL
ncbi:hypothetical protein EPN28_02490 [Patescibacteria group bacterium]|nr:MAG: hypothetical protein EPN28_02490 [Patescibacteria group bacterium]